MPLALLTGGGSLIGEGIACALVARGWQVAVTDINLELARKVSLQAGGLPHAEALALDATNRLQVTATVKDLIARHGAIDALVNAAGGMRGLGIAKADFADTTPDMWDRILTTNFKSVLNCTHAVLPSMLADQRLPQPPAAWSRLRRSRLVGRPCSMLSAGSRAKCRRSRATAQAAILSGVSSYSCCATGAGPRCALRPRTHTVRET